jgi:hypothetical protein
VTLRPILIGVVLAFAATGCTSPSSSAQSATPTPTAGEVRCVARAGPLPDEACTPGATNPDVDADAPAYARTICRAGWTATVRPPTEYTNAVKRWQLLGDPTGRERATVARISTRDPAQVRVGVYGRYAGGGVADYEEDHLIPLALGGAPGDPANLWPEWDASPNPKDTVETAAKRWVCNAAAGDRPDRLATARRLVVQDWRQLAALLEVKVA